MDKEKSELYSIAGFFMEGPGFITDEAFGGFFFDNGCEPAGMIVDGYGASQINNLRFDETSGELEFDKKYLHRADVIHYSLQRKEEGHFEGKYNGDVALCGGVIAHVSQRLYSESEIERLSLLESNLNKKTKRAIESLVNKGVLIPDKSGENYSISEVFEGHDELSPRDDSGELWNADDIPF